MSDEIEASKVNMCFYCRLTDLEEVMTSYQELRPDNDQKPKIIYLCQDCNPSITYKY